MITSYFKSKKKPEGDAKVESPGQTEEDRTQNGKKHQRNDNDSDPTNGSSKRSKKGDDSSVIKQHPMFSKGKPASSSLSSSSPSSPEVMDLMSNLNDESWNIKLKEYTSRPSFRTLAKFVVKER